MKDSQLKRANELKEEIQRISIELESLKDGLTHNQVAVAIKTAHKQRASAGQTTNTYNAYISWGDCDAFKDVPITDQLVRALVLQEIDKREKELERLQKEFKNL